MKGDHRRRCRRPFVEDDGSSLSGSDLSEIELGLGTDAEDEVQEALRDPDLLVYSSEEED